MKYTEVEDFVQENGLLELVSAKPGIYAITIDDYVVYVGQSKNMYQRCCSHIYNMENAILNQEKKYLLLLSAKLGGHKVDCVSFCICDPENLTELEDNFIEFCYPSLNILTPHGKQDISNLKIEDVIRELDVMVIDGKRLQNFSVKKGLTIGKNLIYKKTEEE